jgi:hypothetical protein
MYQQISLKVEQLLALGMGSFEIHKALGVSFGTVSKSLAWIALKNKS